MHESHSFDSHILNETRWLELSQTLHLSDINSEKKVEPIEVALTLSRIRYISDGDVMRCVVDQLHI